MKKNILIGLVLICTVFIARIIPHPPNLVPVSAVALAASVYLTGKYRILIPLIAMLLSDIVLGFYKPEIMLAVYGSFVIIFFIGICLKKRKNILNTMTAAVSSSLIFFVLTNLAVWYFGSWYPKTIQGLYLAYTLAIPFFKNTLIGDLGYTLSIFAIFELVLILQKVKSAKIATT